MHNAAMNTSRPTWTKRHAETHEALHHAAIRLFVERRYEDVTVDEIAAAAGVSRRTFFRYFDSKESVVFARQDRELAEFEALVAEAEALGEVGFCAVVAACLELAASYDSDREVVVVRQSLIERTPSLVAAECLVDLRWESAIADALARGQRPGAGEPETVTPLAGAVMGLIRATLREWRRAPDPQPLVELARRNLRALSGAFGPCARLDPPGEDSRT